MAKYNIKSLNYIACGNVRNFINMDIELEYELYDYIHLLCAEAGTNGYPDADAWRKKQIHENISVDIGTEHGAGDFYKTDYIHRDETCPLAQENVKDGIILNEQQKYFQETDAEKRKYIRLYLSCCTQKTLDQIHKFNDDRIMPNQTYLLENTDNDKNNLSCEGLKLLNAYDIKDVTTKRLGRHERPNEFLTCIKTMYPKNESYVRTHHDVYGPAIYQPPIGFVQSVSQSGFEDDAIIVTNGSTAMPGQFQTDIENYKGTHDGARQQFGVSIESQKEKTYTYKPFDETYQLSDVCVPNRVYDGIYRSFILDMPVNDKFPQNSVTSDYDNGEIYYRRLMTCKNLYDSTYSMNMPSISQISHARTYCGVNSCGDGVYLKYWDDTDYNAVSSSSDYLKNYHTEKSGSFGGRKPYQKIEYVYTNDYSQETQHKSNMFSIEILSTGIDAFEQEQRQTADDTNAPGDKREEAIENLEKLRMLKRDITAAVKEIARNITPANTQLFDIYFNDN